MIFGIICLHFQFPASLQSVGSPLQAGSGAGSDPGGTKLKIPNRFAKGGDIENCSVIGDVVSFFHTCYFYSNVLLIVKNIFTAFHNAAHRRGTQ